jgi:hypothetical protein
MIKIISGTYGHLGGGRVRPKTAASEPFCLTPAQEARLVARGIAVYVNEAPVEADASNTPEYSTRNTVKELQAIGEQFGITFEEGMTKAQMVEILNQYTAGEDEDAPTFDATEAVQ